jgi:hypothetical protein
MEQVAKSKQDKKGQLALDFAIAHRESVRVISINRAADMLHQSLLRQIIETTKSF